MKNIILSLITLTLLITFSCQQHDEQVPMEGNSLQGTWHLVEVLADPGDGSGVFREIESDLSITFDGYGDYTSNGDLCGPNITTDGEGSGSYDMENHLLIPSNCSPELFGSDLKLSYELKNGYFILYFFCIEACAHKFEKAH